MRQKEDRAFYAVAIILITGLLLSWSQASACEISVKVKKTEAKSGITSSGQSMSLATLQKTGCTVTKTLFSESELRAYKIADLEKKLLKLRTK